MCYRMILCAMICVAAYQSACAKTIDLQRNCSLLEDEHAVLLVHASWCPHCQHYLPVYQALSEEPEFADYRFYVQQDDDFAPVCEHEIKRVPETFIHNMAQSQPGHLTKERLRAFIKHS